MLTLSVEVARTEIGYITIADGAVSPGKLVAAFEPTAALDRRWELHARQVEAQLVGDELTAQEKHMLRTQGILPRPLLSAAVVSQGVRVGRLLSISPPDAGSGQADWEAEVWIDG